MAQFPTQNPGQNPQDPTTVVITPFKPENAEQLRQFLSHIEDLNNFPQTFEEWKPQLDLVTTPIPSEATSKRAGAYKELVKQQYLELLKKQNQTFRLLQTVPRTQMAHDIAMQQLRLHEQGQQVNPQMLQMLDLRSADELTDYVRELERAMDNMRIAIMVNLAQYSADLKSYVEFHGSAEEVERDVPNYLLEYLDISPREEVSLKFSTFVLPMQYDVVEREQIPGKPMDVEGRSNYLLLIAMKKRLKVKHVLDYVAASGNEAASRDVCVVFLEECGVVDGDATKEDIDAARLLLGYLSKHEDAIRRSADLNPLELNDLTISEAVEVAARDSTVFNYVQRFIDTAGDLDVSDVAESLEQSFNEIAEGNQIHAVLFGASEYSAGAEEVRKQRDELTERQLSEYKRDAEAVADFMRSTESSLVKVADMEGYLDQNKKKLLVDQRFMVKEICNEIGSQEMYEKCSSILTRRTHGIINKVSDFVADRLIGDLNTKTDEALKEILLEKNISLKDAFELYYVLHTNGETEEGATSLPVTLKLVQVLRNGKHPEVAAQWNSIIMGDITEAAVLFTLGKTDDAEEVLKRFGLNEKEMTELRNVILYFKDIGLGEAWGKWYQSLVRAWAEHPVIYTLLGGSGGAGAAYLAWRAAPTTVDLYYTTRWITPRLKDFAFIKDVSQLEAKYGGPDVPRSRLLAIQKEVKDLYLQRREFSGRVRYRIQAIRRAHMLRKNAGKSLSEIAKAVYRPRNRVAKGAMAVVNKLFGDTYHYYESPADVAAYLHRIQPGDAEGIKTALQAIGLSEADADAEIQKVMGTAGGGPSLPGAPGQSTVEGEAERADSAGKLDADRKGDSKSGGDADINVKK